MIIESQRFGTIELLATEVFTLYHGLPGRPAFRHFAWIPDAADESRAWLQSADAPTLALRLMSPLLCIPGYQLTIPQEALPILAADSPQAIEAYIRLENTDHGLTAQFDYPILIHRAARRGISVSLPEMPELTAPDPLLLEQRFKQRELLVATWETPRKLSGGFQLVAMSRAIGIQ